MRNTPIGWFDSSSRFLAAVFSDMASGRVQMMFGCSATAPLAKEDRIRALAVMLPVGSTLLPDTIPAQDAGLGQVNSRA